MCVFCVFISLNNNKMVRTYRFADYFYLKCAEACPFTYLSNCYILKNYKSAQTFFYKVQDIQRNEMLLRKQANFTTEVEKANNRFNEDKG